MPEPDASAGNRNDAVTDNLNRATSIGGVTCSNDILGNRLTKGTASYAWDVLNRMTSYTSPSPDSIATSYVYRADGMRVSKSDSTGSAVYRYDGQMCMQDVETVGSTVTTTNYALGARGIDAVSKTVETFQNGQWVASPAQVGYPIYDAHGDRVATLTKSGTSFSLTDVRTYDAWGNVRVGAQTGRPRARYCANLGHVQDDESGLVYMRARYYEPTSGRFVSEDPALHGVNWFSYAMNCPTELYDPSGHEGELTENLVCASESRGLWNFIFDRLALNVFKDVANRLTLNVGWITKFGGSSTSVAAFIKGLEEFARGEGSSEIVFRFTSSTPGGAEFIDKMIDELGTRIGYTSDGIVDQIMWTIEAMG